MSDEQTVAGEKTLSKEQKIGFILLLVFGVVGIALGAIQMRNTLLAPFALNNSIPTTIKDQANDVEALRLRDTDGDGLSDYDELYVYGTSPYLYDTFGYGFSDKEVVTKGLARCANAGKDCSNESTPLGSTSSTNLGAGQSTLGEAPPDFNQLVNNPQQLRKLLSQSGVSEDVLAKVSDQDLMQMVSQLMASSTFATSTR